MVLEEASSPTESSAEIQPTSDIDPYSSSSSYNTASSSGSYLQLPPSSAESSEPIYINLANLPRPFSIFFEAEHRRNFANGIHATCTYASKVLQRPLRQEEADAFAFHWAKSMRIASYGTPVGVSAAMLWAYRVGDFRFPLWKPMKEGGKYSPDKLGPLRGPAARATWQILRYNAYGFVGLLFGQLFFASYALTVHAAARALDPRLKEFTEALKLRQQEGINRAREMQQQAQGEAPARQGETFEMARQRRAVAQQQQQRQSASRRKAADVDDMSPTGGSFTDDFMDTGGSDTGIMSDGQTREQQSRAENATNTFGLARENASDSRSSTMTANSPPQPQPSQQQQASSSSSSPPRQTGSAWERLRQNAMAGNSPASASPSAAASNSSSARSSRAENSFSFSQSEEDRQLARSEAQRDFDSRIEREREGKDFGDGGGGSGGGGRWGR